MSAPRIPDEVWESHKETIRDLYQREELKDLIRIMEESYQFRATDKQYIRRLGKWQFKKYTTSEKWQHAAQLLSKRQIEGKESELLIDGRPVPKKKLKKELARLVAPTMQTAQIVAPGSAPLDGVEVYTPPAIITEASNYIRIPWSDTEKLIEAKLTQIRSMSSYNFAATPSYPGQIIDLDHIWPTIMLDSEAYIQSRNSQRSLFNNLTGVLEMDRWSRNLNGPTTALGDGRTHSASTFNREACSVLAQLMGKTIDPDSDDYVSEISSDLKAVLVEKNQGDLINNMAETLNSSPWDLASQLLRYSIYLLSNNLISETRVDVLLEWITRHEQFNAIKILISMKTPTTDTFAAYLLVSAARLQDLDTVRDLIALGIDVNVPVGYVTQTTALYEATKNKNIRLVDVLICAGANPKHSHPWSQPIDKAISANEKDILIILLRAWTYMNLVNYNPTYKDFRSAIQNGDPELVRILLASGRLIYGDGRNPIVLWYAAQLDKLEIVQILLNAGADVESDASAQEDEDYFGVCHRYPIQHAAYNDNIKMVQILLDYGANANAYNHDEHFWMDIDHHDRGFDCIRRRNCLTALQYAAVNKNSVMAAVLLKAGAEVDSFTSGGTPLQIAVEENDMNMVKLLLSHNANINAPAWMCRGRTALQSAVEKRSHDLIDFLIQEGANINASAATHFGCTVIQAAVESSDINMVEKLFALGADINAPPSKLGGRTCLQLAAEMGDAKMVRKLLELGADIDGPISSGRINGPTPLRAALDGDHMEVFRLLLDAHSLTGTVSSVLPVITSSRNLEMIRHFLNTTLYTKEELSFCLLKAIKSGVPEIVRYILDKGADVNYYTSSCLAPIHEAVASVNIIITRILIDAKADLNQASRLDRLTIGPSEMMRPLAVAAVHEDLELIQLLLSSGALADYEPSCDGFETTALDAAVSSSYSSGRKDIIQALLESGADVNREFKGGELPLNWLIKMKKPELVSLFLEWGADVNKTDKLGMTALQSAANVNDLELMKTLLHAGASASINPLAINMPRYGRTALQSAVESENQTAVLLLLENGADYNAAAAQDGGVTALQAAAISGSMPISVLLLEAGAEMNAPAARINGRTALEGAAEHGHLQIVLLLLENDPDRNGLEARCKKAAKYAEKEHPITAKFLKEYKAV